MPRSAPPQIPPGQRLFPVNKVPAHIGGMLADPTARPSLNSVMRWLLSHKLRAVKLGGRWMTCSDWIQSFLESNSRQPTSAPPRTPAQRERAILRADRRVAARGL